MSASIWNPGVIVTSLSTAAGTTKEDQNLAAGQTVITFGTIIYAVGVGALYLHLNGALLLNSIDYAETSTTSVTLTTPASAGDVITAMAITNLQTNTAQTAVVPEVDMASAVTTNIGASQSDFIRITGTSGIASFGTIFRGPIFIRFQSGLTLTNSATLICPGGVNLVVTAGQNIIATPKATNGTSDGWVVRT